MIKGVAKRAVVGLFLMLVILLAGCSTQSSKNAKLEEIDQEAGKHEIASVKIVEIPSDFGAPAPFLHYRRGPGYTRMSFIFDTLLWEEEEGVKPALAESWEFSEEDNAYIFEIREGVKWHDDEKFSADDVAFTFEYLKQHPYEFCDTSAVAEVEKLDNRKVKIYLDKPYAPFLNTVATILPILPKHIYEGVEDPHNYKDTTAFVGTGPYKFKTYDKQQATYVYEANDDYYLGTPKYREVTLMKINPQMAPNALLKGEINGSAIPGDLTMQMKEKGFKVLESHNGLGIRALFNHTKEPFKDRRFRKAIAYAIDREEIVNVAQRGFAEVGNPGYFVAGSKWRNESVERYEYNLKKAKELLEELGYKKNGEFYEKDGEVLEFTIEAEDLYKRDMEIIQKQMEKLGVNLNIRIADKQNIDLHLSEMNFDVAITARSVAGDPLVFSTNVLGKAFNCDRFYENEVLTKLLEEQNTLTDEEERRTALYEAQEIYADELPSLYLYYSKKYFATDNTLDLFYSREGVSLGSPVPTNKAAFIAKESIDE